MSKAKTFVSTERVNGGLPSSYLCCKFDEMKLMKIKVGPSLDSDCPANKFSLY